jgi:hypothetical protein
MLRASRPRLRLEQATHLALILFCIVSASAIIFRSLASRHTVVPRQPIANLVGTTLPLPVNWEQSRTTFVVVLTSECPYCIASAPFYRHLAGVLHKSEQTPMLLVVASPEQQPDTREFLADHGIPADVVVSASLSSLGVSGTPALFVVDSRGRIRGAFQGKLSSTVEQSLIEKLGGPYVH